MSKSFEKLSAIFSTGLYWKSEGHFLEQLGPLGFSRKAFRAFCRQLKVPMVHIGKHRYVDTLSFVMALRYISRVGRKDFLAPGCATLISGKKPKGSVTEIDPVEFRKDMEIVLAELFAANKMQKWLGSDSNFKKLVRQAVDRMEALARANPQSEYQHDADSKRVRQFEIERAEYERATATPN